MNSNAITLFYFKTARSRTHDCCVPQSKQRSTSRAMMSDWQKFIKSWTTFHNFQFIEILIRLQMKQMTKQMQKNIHTLRILNLNINLSLKNCHVGWWFSDKYQYFSNTDIILRIHAAIGIHLERSRICKERHQTTHKHLSHPCDALSYLAIHNFCYLTSYWATVEQIGAFSHHTIIFSVSVSPYGYNWKSWEIWN